MEKAIIAKIGGKQYIIKKSSLKKISQFFGENYIGGLDDKKADAVIDKNPTESISENPTESSEPDKETSEEYDRIKWATDVHGAIYVDFSKLLNGEDIVLKLPGKTHNWSYKLDDSINKKDNSEKSAIVFTKHFIGNQPSGFFKLKQMKIYINKFDISVNYDENVGYILKSEPSDKKDYEIYQNKLQNILNTGSESAVLDRELLKSIPLNETITLELAPSTGKYWSLKENGENELKLHRSMGKKSSVDELSDVILTKLNRSTASKNGDNTSLTITSVNEIAYNEVLQNSLDKTKKMIIDLNEIKENNEVKMEIDKIHKWKINHDGTNIVEVFRAATTNPMSKGVDLKVGSLEDKVIENKENKKHYKFSYRETDTENMRFLSITPLQN